MYHGVTELPRQGLIDFSGKHVRLELFRDQVRMLADRRRIVPLRQLVQELRAGADVRGMVSLTFDDGYLNNVECAAPALLEHGLTGTFFLATGFIGQNRWAWTDRLEAAIDAAPGGERELSGGIGMVRLDGRQSRIDTLRAIKSRLKQLPWREAEARVSEVSASLGVSIGSPAGLYRFMDWNGARWLAAHGFDVGAHTVNHAILSRVSVRDAEEEIYASQDRIVAETGGCNPVFCYPNGKFSDFTPDVIEVCKKRFVAALAAEYGAAHASELFALRRVPVDDRTSVSRLASMIAQSG